MLRLGTVLHAGETLRDEIRARGMTYEQAASFTGLSLNTIQAIIGGRRAITPWIAVRLEDTLHITAEFWMFNQTQWDLQIERRKLLDHKLKRR